MTTVTSDDVLARLADVVLSVARELDPTGPRALDVVPLTGTEVMVMRWVDTNPGTTPSATAEATALRRSNLSVALGSLVAKGMVERRAHPDDARTAQLFPTARAAESVALLRSRWAATLRSALDGQGIDTAAVTSAVGLLERIEDGLRPSRAG
ncbi:MarR family winged helix-turn-helix transcriptional regulator [Curtobacterium herbarum]|uniref:HTH marR-type domain-containing protein n=1 Tax=Curtobacterium herbarum TaxID=150122 RepID=A0ABP4K691_9MICO|nr:MarR family winged helix-turn-helix transcriptional regulator [Curtobacterium herbarum]MBM7476855.1 DNA-binding MarR family transcriptional regulator [Curtobacterium herbarum]MCS6545134.1 MarR family winged helix-turn-helix transcriptional regulator [Curtobacterium herbarum]